MEDLYRLVLDAGDDALVAFGRGKAPKTVKSYRIGGDLDVLFHAGMSRLTDGQGTYSRKATKKLIDIIQDYEPDIIHLHNIHGYYLNYTILFDFLKSYGRPVIWTMHDCWAFTGHCAHYEGVGCDGWQTGCQRCRSPFVYPKAYVARYTAENYERKRETFLLPKLQIVTPSYWLKEQLQQSFFKKTPCTVIPNGIDLTVFREEKSDVKQQLGIENKKMILGVASVWTRFKGMDDFQELSKRMGPGYVICMIGLKKDQMKKLPAGIIAVERTENQSALAKYYAAADIFLNPTYEDTFPTTNIEALACGTPVVTYRTGGSPEIVGEGCGKAVERGNFERLIEEVKTWAERDCSSQCRERAMNYEKGRCYRQYLECYRTLV